MRDRTQKRSRTRTPAEPAGVLFFRGIRGAITVDIDSYAAIAVATRRLLGEMIARNEVEPAAIASVFFSLTPDLRAGFPALAAREMGWASVAMLDLLQLDVPGALERCIRVLMHVNTPRNLDEIEHVYLDGAAGLRPDLVRSVS